MRKYKVIVEAELILNDYMDNLDLLQFNKSKVISNLINEDDEYENEYKFYLDFWNITTPEELATADINKITVTEITE